MNEFITSDGFRLLKHGSIWTDGDLVFVSDTDGWPIDNLGERLEGEMKK
jgi:hypothetical protein